MCPQKLVTKYLCIMEHFKTFRVFPNSMHWDKRGVWELWDGNKTSLQELKVKTNCNFFKRWLLQIGTKLHMDILMGNWHSKDTSQLKLVVSSFPYFMMSNVNYIKVAKTPKSPKREFQHFFQFCQVMNCHTAQNLWRKKVFQGRWKARQIMSKNCLNLILDIKHGNQIHEHELCKTNVQMEFYSNNIWNHEHETNKVIVQDHTSYWCWTI
jgi:hypothetical protein